MRMNLLASFLCAVGLGFGLFSLSNALGADQDSQAAAIQEDWNRQNEAQAQKEQQEHAQLVASGISRDSLLIAGEPTLRLTAHPSHPTAQLRAAAHGKIDTTRKSGLVGAVCLSVATLSATSRSSRRRRLSPREETDAGFLQHLIGPTPPATQPEVWDHTGTTLHVTIVEPPEGHRLRALRSRARITKLRDPGYFNYDDNMAWGLGPGRYTRNSPYKQKKDPAAPAATLSCPVVGEVGGEYTPPTSEINPYYVRAFTPQVYIAETYGTRPEIPAELNWFQRWRHRLRTQRAAAVAVSEVSEHRAVHETVAQADMPPLDYTPSGAEGPDDAKPLPRAPDLYNRARHCPRPSEPGVEIFRLADLTRPSRDTQTPAAPIMPPAITANRELAAPPVLAYS